MVNVIKIKKYIFFIIIFINRANVVFLSHPTFEWEYVEIKNNYLKPFYAAVWTFRHWF
jgi:hypothetical protein